MSNKTYILNYKQKNVFHIQGTGVSFVPGTNFLTEKQWEKIKNHPLLAYKFDNGHLVFAKGRGPDDYIESKVAPKKDSDEEVVSEEENVNDLIFSASTKEAKEIVESTFDVKVLEYWKEKETRKGVLSAIEDQLEKINAQKLKEDE